MKYFAPYSLDTENQYLRRGSEIVALTPKSYSVLAYLLENAGRLVTKQELLDTVWPGTHIHEGVLKASVLEIRRALQDEASSPKYIQTRHRRGYQFIAPVQYATSREAAPAVLLGREAELEQIVSVWHDALAGSRQILFIAGEPGIGKTALIDHFLNSTPELSGARIARGQCLEHFGDREPYYPVLDAVSHAARTWPEQELLNVLRRYAPTWLMQMPALIPAGEMEQMRQISLGSTRDRMLRELAEALEVLAAARPLILVLEDLHWSDVATVDLIAWIANRRLPVPLLLIGAYRPVELIAAEHPLKGLKQELLGRRLCTELPLDVLSREVTGEFVSQRFVPNDFPEPFAELIYRVTDGHPLFLVNAIDDAVARSVVVYADGRWSLRAPFSEMQISVPESVMEMIDRQIERLNPHEQAILESASICGGEFGTAWIADVTGENGLDIEQNCESLVRRKLFIRSAPDRRPSFTLTGSPYAFIHSLYREAFYRRVGPGRRQQLHASFASRIENLYAGRERDKSPELAYHFQQGDDPRRALPYLAMAAQQAGKRHAPREAVTLIRQAFALVERWPEPERADIELRLLEDLGLLYRLTGQLRDAADTFERMVYCAVGAGNLQAQITAQQWLAGVLSWFDRDRCLHWVDRTRDLPVDGLDATARIIMRAHIAYWNLLFRAWSENDAAASAAAVEACKDVSERSSVALINARHGFFLCLSGKYREAVRITDESLAIALAVDSYLDYSIAHYFQLWALLQLGEWGRMRRVLVEALGLAQRNGHVIWVLVFRLLEMWLHVQAFSYRTALRIGLECLQESKALSHTFSEQISLILLGFAHTGIGEHELATERFAEIGGWHSRERLLMDWIWKLPLQQGLCELSIQERDWLAAARQAETFREMTSVAAEPTWRTLACCAQATAALHSGCADLAAAAIQDADAEIAGIEAPLAEWRLHWLAYQLHGDEERLRRAQHVVLRLAGSLDESDPLRESFLSADPVRAVLRDGCPLIAAHRN